MLVKFEDDTAIIDLILEDDAAILNQTLDEEETLPMDVDDAVSDTSVLRLPSMHARNRMIAKKLKKRFAEKDADISAIQSEKNAAISTIQCDLSELKNKLLENYKPD
ncbi:hypothetical protein DAPPUDRAFT_334011 [Daphnia pulex]|uniref:Uncharacterized protein n=1 Tax=Daphnia pulex TaxID=6669 RepID=E9HUG4_DAPPU|nr:hypothetical protein DAPPUDRAFT_334011 [Daphnia pulex]|eukprot:EFX64619.1 hypothetical protein DAPPUDRAFT_334011 [Daphnia pulex]